jgi:glycosyltransferase involved in cell wall biosynthesis
MDGSLPATLSPSSPPEVSIVIPARNEEASLGTCLESLTRQTEVAFEIIVVDDGSTDRTREIAQSFAGVRVISPAPQPVDRAGKRWTGKNNAVVAGAEEACAPWLLFTDADTVHSPGSLARAVDEAKREHADLLSYSPEQIVETFSERAVTPVIFAELAAHYPLHKVRDQNSGVVAANGQYILLNRVAYDSVGGHGAVATEILEDVALARLFRDAGLRVYFRYGGDAVQTRMYRSWAQLREGWTKNLALLFPHPGRVAAYSLFQWTMASFAVYVAASGAFTRHLVWTLAAALWLLVYRRIRTSHFTTANNLIAIAFGLPLFAYLLQRSKRAHANGQVSWKGRAYEVVTRSNPKSSNAQSVKAIRESEDQGLRATSQELGAKS